METVEERAAARRASWVGIVAHSFREAEDLKRAAYDAIPPHERAEAIWELVMRMPWGDDATEYRLDRTVARVKRGGR
jgi:hypothetical protein